MNEYQITMSINGVLTLLGVAYVSLIFRKLNMYVTGNRLVVAGPIFGGFLIAVGFLGSMHMVEGPLGTLLLVLLLIGPGIMLYPLGRLEMLVPTRRFILQFFLILLTLFLIPCFRDPTAGLFYTGTLIVLLVLIHSLLVLRILSPFLKHSLLASSWLLVLHSWLRVAVNTPLSTAVLLMYSSVLVFWIYSAMGIYDYLGRWL